MKDKEPIDFFICKEHGEVVYNVIKNGIPMGMECRLGCEIDDLLDVRLGMGWMFTWDELGLDKSPFADDSRM